VIGVSGRRSGCLALSAALVLAACAPAEPPSAGAPASMRRLSNDQYRNIIADVFGPQITVAGQADALQRSDSLLAVGASKAEITPSGYEKYYAMAQSVAAQAVDPDNRASVVPCTPRSAAEPDEKCARQFLAKVGRLLYRRPLAPAELALAVRIAGEGARLRHDFYGGLEVALTGMLQSPQFLFVVDTLEPDPAHAGRQRLTAYARAARLSFLLWNTSPNEQLLAAAEQGALDTAGGREDIVERMLSSVRVEAGIRAFFEDFLHFDQFETLEKDSVIYPAFSVRVVEDAREQVLRTVLQHVLEKRADYRDLFTTRETFITGSLARIYRVPTPKPEGSAWVAFEFPADDPRAGLLTEVGFAALASHPGRSSPTLRGRAIRENLLCQKVPNPPGNVDFSRFESADAQKKTARERLAMHSTNAACAGCHKITDPIGLALENLDGIGQYRTTENGAVIDASGTLDGVPFNDAAGLGRAMRDNPATTSCVVQRLASYALGRNAAGGDKPYVDYLNQTFARDDYDFLELLRRVALSETLFAVRPPAGAGYGMQTARTAP
jgi:hypothetical protein